jgi:signal transduction histidine kinase
MNPQPLVVIGSGGTVLAVAGNLAPGLADVPIEQCHDLPPHVRDAAMALLRRLRESGSRVATETVPVDSGTLQLVAVDAIPISRSPTDLRTLVTSKLAVIHSQAITAGITLTVDVAADVPTAVRVDPVKIAWAITTLVGNALRYAQTASRTLRGRSIAVRTTYQPASSTVVIEVQDDGPGVPADTVARLFKHDGLNVRGAGLSLLLISEIMAAHGGTIDVTSSTDAAAHGTTVRLTLPIR